MSPILLSRIGYNIKKLRLSKNISKKTMAGELNINRKRLKDLEQGEQDIRITTLIKIAKYLDVMPWVLCSTRDVVEAAKKYPFIETDLINIFADKLVETQINQSDLAMKVDISTINRIIRRRYNNPCITTIEIIAEAANIKFEDIFRNVHLSEKEED